MSDSVVGEGIILTVILAGVVVVVVVAFSLAENSSSQGCCEVRFPVIIFNACRSLV